MEWLRSVRGPWSLLSAFFDKTLEEIISYITKKYAWNDRFEIWQKWLLNNTLTVSSYPGGFFMPEKGPDHRPASTYIQPFICPSCHSSTQNDQFSPVSRRWPVKVARWALLHFLSSLSIITACLTLLPWNHQRVQPQILKVSGHSSNVLHFRGCFFFLFFTAGVFRPAKYQRRCNWGGGEGIE